MTTVKIQQQLQEPKIMIWKIPVNNPLWLCSSDIEVTCLFNFDAVTFTAGAKLIVSSMFS